MSNNISYALKRVCRDTHSVSFLSKDILENPYYSNRRWSNNIEFWELKDLKKLLKLAYKSTNLHTEVFDNSCEYYVEEYSLINTGVSELNPNTFDLE